MIGYARLLTWWIVEQIGSGWELESHVRPIDDLIEHEFEADCVCGPTIDENDNGIIVIHHSLDGRERYEEDYEDDEEEDE